MSQPIVSVVIPAYNAAKTIGMAIRGVLEQTVHDLEVIVVDDGSTDGTAEVVEAVADERVEIIRRTNGGTSTARNTGISSSKGKYVALLDADDLWMPTKLERQIEMFRDLPEIDAVKTAAYFVNDELELLSVEQLGSSADPLLDILMMRNVPATMSTLMVKREVFDKTGMFAVDLPAIEDWDFLIRLAKVGHIQDLDEPLAVYRRWPGSRSKNLDAHVQAGNKILEKVFADPGLPAHIRRKRPLVYSAFFSMLSGAAFSFGLHKESLKWGVKALASDPRRFIYMVSMPFRKIARRRSRALVPPEFGVAIERFRQMGEDANGNG